MKRILVFFWVIGAACSFSNTRLMLIGDSVTLGVKSANDLGLRDDLVDSIHVHAYPIDWVGSFGAPPYAGHFRSGAKIGDFYYGPDGNGSFDVSYDLDTFQPNIAMVHLGTNDVVSSDQIAPYSLDGGQHFHTVSVSGRLAFLLSSILQWKNGQRGNCIQFLFVSKIIPRLDCLERVKALNREIESMVKDSEAGNVPGIPPGSLRLVDQYSTFVPSQMTDSDGVHPNEPGYVHMAGIYFNALESLPMAVAKISGDGQNTDVGAEMPLPMVIRTLNGKGKGVEGVTVRFEVKSGSAVLIGSISAATDAAGDARIRCRGTTVGMVEVLARGNVLFQKEAVFQATTGLYANIDGKIVTALQNAPIPNVRMMWMEETGREDTSDTDGSYRLSRLPLGGNVTIKPFKNRYGDVGTAAIKPEDARLAAGAATGLTALSSEGFLAADADGDGVISMYDAFQIARAAEGFRSFDLFQVGKWIFLPDMRTFSQIAQDSHNQGFRGILVGDVQGSWRAGSGQGQNLPGGFPVDKNPEPVP
jgi:lysophospholipase L1-like esterase